MKRTAFILFFLAVMLILPGYVIKRGPSTATRSMQWGAGAMSVDGTNCVAPVEATINSGPKQFVIVCGDNDASLIYGSTIMPDGYDGGTVTFELSLVNLNADPDSDTPDSDYDVDFSVSCRGNSDVVNNTYGSEKAADVDFDAAGSCGASGCVQYELVQVTTEAVTGNGTCAGGDALFWIGAVDATGTTSTQVADINLLNVKMEYTWTPGD
jgi:hypothetical protein